jgi:hypothetical protein
MTDYRINLPGCPGIDRAAQAAMWNAFSALLEHELSGAKVLVTVYYGWQDVMLHCKEWSMPNDTEDEDRMAWSLATTLKEGLVVGARPIPGNSHDRHTGHIHSSSHHAIATFFSPTSNRVQQRQACFKGLDD